MPEEDGRRGATVITLYGSCPGVGRTTIAVNLAVALAQSGHKVALVDLDVRFGDVAILLDIPVEWSISDLPIEDGELSVEMLLRCLYTHKTGVTILPAPIRPKEWQSVGAAHVQQAVALLIQTHDYVILDSPKNYRVVSAALEPADSLFLVTTEAVSSLESTKLDLRMLCWWGFPQDKIKLITNATNEVTNMEPQSFEQALGGEVFAAVPYDRNISRATQLGTPLVVSHPESRAAQSILGLAEAVVVALKRMGPVALSGEPTHTDEGVESPTGAKMTRHDAPERANGMIRWLRNLVDPRGANSLADPVLSRFLEGGAWEWMGGLPIRLETKSKKTRKADNPTLKASAATKGCADDKRNSRRPAKRTKAKVSRKPSRIASKRKTKVMSDQSEEDTFYALKLTDALRRLVVLGMSESDLLKTTSVLESLVGELTHGKGADFLDQSDETVQHVMSSGAAVKGMVPEDAIDAYDLINVLRALLVVGMSEYDGLKTTMVLQGLLEELTGEKLTDA